MKKLLLLVIITAFTFDSHAQYSIGDLKKNAEKAKKELNNATTGANKTSNLSNDEIVQGLKEALNVGSKNSADFASKVDGYFGNTAIKIPLPPDVKSAEQKLRQMGMGSQVDKAILNMNRAAEEAAKQAAPIFLNAISQMSIADGVNILKGTDNAATKYLQQTTNTELFNKFKPIVQQALKKVSITEYWNPVVLTYNKIPMVKKLDPNLDEYVTNKGLDGLFYLVAQEELKIRKNPSARVTDILKKVFGQN